MRYDGLEFLAKITVPPRALEAAFRERCVRMVRAVEAQRHRRPMGHCMFVVQALRVQALTARLQKQRSTTCTPPNAV